MAHMALHLDARYDATTRRWTLRVLEPSTTGSYDGPKLEVLIARMLERAVEEGVLTRYRDPRPWRLRLLEWVFDHLLDPPAHLIERAVQRALPYRADDHNPVREAVAGWLQWATYMLCPWSHTWAHRHIIDESPNWPWCTARWPSDDDEDGHHDEDEEETDHVPADAPNTPDAHGVPAGGAAPPDLRDETGHDAAPPTGSTLRRRGSPDTGA